MEYPHQLRIIDSDGIIGIANVTRYNETLAFQNDWTWRQLGDFLFHKNNGNLIAFSTGNMQEWVVSFLIGSESEMAYFRKLEQNVEVTDGYLYLASWGDITCTLQFKNTLLPGMFNQGVRVPVPNGHYRAVVKQVADPEDYEANSAVDTHFIVELLPCAPEYQVIPDSMPWSDYFPNSDSIFMSNDPDEWEAFTQDLIDKYKNPS